MSNHLCICAFSCPQVHMLLENAFCLEGTSPSADQAPGSSVATLVKPPLTDPLPPTTVVPMGQQTVMKPEYYRYLPGSCAAMFSYNPSSDAEWQPSQDAAAELFFAPQPYQVCLCSMPRYSQYYKCQTQHCPHTLADSSA